MMKNRIGAFAISALLIAAGALTASGQSIKVDHFTEAQLTQMAHAMDGKIQNGMASDDLSKYPNHFTMLILRNKNGGAEVHENFADFFVVVEGHATLVSGGTVKDPKTASPGEIRGTALENGTKEALNPGDLIHIPATLPHQLLLADGDRFVYFVLKIKEK
jgi:mannose-6-phosphate isomerase-like protein (cupin superfamily)